VKDVEKGKLWGYVAFGPKYTEAMVNRATFGLHAEDEHFRNARIKFRVDQSSKS
jgi:hypothetical protein